MRGVSIDAQAWQGLPFEHVFLSIRHLRQAPFRRISCTSCRLPGLNLPLTFGFGDFEDVPDSDTKYASLEAARGLNEGPAGTDICS